MLRGRDAGYSNAAAMLECRGVVDEMHLVPFLYVCAKVLISPFVGNFLLRQILFLAIVVDF